MKQEIGRNRSGLRLGYTTGSCAAAAAKAAVAMLLKEEEITHVKLITPKGIELYLEVESTIRTADYVQCAVEKYSGDDIFLSERQHSGMYKTGMWFRRIIS